ncbi:DNA-formamidopyrimidine glycosylase [Paenibacillus abyssi]|uniref:Formamidopyrimidine-DNA glycosylase n=1 Tax=Paenibacillus abyssi TaxID=1340531 RepID=A0A917FMR2_9BACL|nr:DNA-formamidopyrimidine glycosylase [Paenibacillus abyssi]GGF89859.1 DNA-formamidopyrimidine glycosylase [Paenibacillus abyssi]
MPEWPEMETYRVMLSERIVGETIIGTEVTRDKSINVPVDRFNDELKGRSIWYVERRGKYILFHLDNGRRLLLHLMLGGLMYFGTDEDRPSRSIQVTLKFPQGNLYFMGLRLGFLHLLTVKEVEAKLSSLGPEPMDKRLTFERFRALLQTKRGTIKSTFVDQQVIAGIGNSYVDEIAFAAGIRPTAKIPEIAEETWERLYTAMHSVLREAASSGGYIEHPFTKDDLLTGGYNERFHVYDREGEPCLKCGNPIIKTEISSRKAFYCPVCQKEH